MWEERQVLWLSKGSNPFLFSLGVGLDSWTLLLEVYGIFSNYKGIEDLVGVSGQTIRSRRTVSSHKGKGVWENTFGVAKVATVK